MHMRATMWAWWFRTLLYAHLCRSHAARWRDATCNLASDLAHLSQPTPGWDGAYPRQMAMGPMQADEMLLLFGLVRSSSVARVLEIGGLQGTSAYNFLQALRCKHGGPVAPMVITVDINPVHRWESHLVTHRTLQKDATLLTMADIGGEAVDAILLDCHAFYASQHILLNVFDRGLLSANGFLFLHDTGLHDYPTPLPKVTWAQLNKQPPGWVHQPVERLIAQWVTQQDCAFQRVSAHDDARDVGPRHGLTIMQRRVDLTVSDCSTGERGKRFLDYEPSDCRVVQLATQREEERCRARTRLPRPLAVANASQAPRSHHGHAHARARAGVEEHLAQHTRN